MDTLHSPTVCIINASPYVFGAEKSMAATVKAMMDVDIRFTLISPGGRTETLFRSSGVAQTDTVPLFLYRRSRNPFTLAKSAFRLLLDNVRVARLLKRNQPDIIHANGLQSLLPLILSVKVLRFPVVWHVRDLRASRWPYFFGYWMSKALVVTSEACLNKCRKTLGPRVHLFEKSLENHDLNSLPILHAPNPIFAPEDWPAPDEIASAIEDRMNRLENETAPFRIGLIGQMIPRKGHHVLLDALPQVLEKIPQAEIWFVGDDPFQPDSEYSRLIRRRVAESEYLKNHVRFMGYQENMNEIYKALDIVAVPSLEEAFGRVPLEAMACGCPVIASKTGGLAESVQHQKNGLLFETGNPNEFARCLVKLSKSPVHFKRLIHEGKKTAQRHQEKSESSWKALISFYGATFRFTKTKYTSTSNK